MALKVNDYVMPDETTVPEAYLRVRNILIENNDYEFLEPIPDTDDLKVSWLTKLDCKATIYVYADEGCRRNQVPPIHWFTLDFFIDKQNIDNPFEWAYLALREKFPRGIDV